MEELFRFLMARPPQRVDVDKTAIPVRPDRTLHALLRRAKEAGGAPAVVRVAQEFSASAEALTKISDLTRGTALVTFAQELGDKAQAPLETLRAAVKTHFGITATDLVANAGFVRDQERLANSLIVSAILGRDEPVPADDAARLLRAMALVERVAAGDATLASPGGVAGVLSRPLVLPPDLFPLRAGAQPPAPQPPQPQPPGTPAPSRDALVNSRNKLLATYNMLTRVTPDHLAIPKPAVFGVRGEGGTPMAALPPIVHLPAGEVPAAATPSMGGGDTDLDRPAVRPAPRLLLTRSAADALPEVARTVLTERRLDLTTVTLPVVLDRLSIELADVETQLANLDRPPADTMIRIGSTLVPGSALMPLFPFLPFPPAVPTTHGSVAPAGIGDLLVVRQFLKRYEARELAHIENILKGEFKERMHRRARTTEETITVETEVKKEEERDVQTTERFELKTEASETIKQDQSLKIGLSVSGSYGPMVEFKATTDFAMNQSKEASSKVATSYSKDVTERATSKIFERRRVERILKTIEQFEEKNTHGFDNKAGVDHVVGQYQWVDKVYEAQVFNYGKRLLFDLMLPEPGAFLLYAMTVQPKAGADLVKPAPFTLTPLDLSEWNYVYYVKQYEVTGVTPPPQPYLAVAKAIEGKGSKDGGTTKTVEIPLPDGYQAVGYEWASRYNYWDDGSLEVVILPAPINNVVGTITLAVKSRKIEAFTVSLAIYCQRTQRALDDWKLKTHSAILQGYLKLLRDYEDKLAAAEVQAVQQIQGRNPVENERLIRAEIKKGAISVFTEQHYDLFGAIESSPQGYPQSNLPIGAAQGRYIRFFEQAFEWEQMMFFFYPYFWGRKENWKNRTLLQDVDPLFAEFIKAGSARVVVSVRPGFEQAIAHFLDTGQVWNGGDLPPITSPLYVSIIEEIRERDMAPGKEIAQGDPWDVRLPTTLVKLRSLPDLPAWKKNPQGEWVPV